MTKYKVKNSVRLQTETDRIEQIIKTWRYSGKQWEPKELQDSLKTIGMEYTDSEMDAIIGELVSRDVIEKV